MSIDLNSRAHREMEEAQRADMRVWKIMELVVAEWESDPLSVRCFDLRLVDEAIALVRRRKNMKDMFNPFTTE